LICARYGTLGGWSGLCPKNTWFPGSLLVPVLAVGGLVERAHSRLLCQGSGLRNCSQVTSYFYPSFVVCF